MTLIFSLNIIFVLCCQKDQSILQIHLNWVFFSGILCEHVHLLELTYQGTLCKGENITLTCKIEDSQFTSNIIWSKGDPHEKYTECTTTGVCFKTMDGRINISANASVSEVAIYGLSHNRDETKWICCSPEDKCTSINIQVCSK